MGVYIYTPEIQVNVEFLPGIQPNRVGGCGLGIVNKTFCIP